MIGRTLNCDARFSIIRKISILPYCLTGGSADRLFFDILYSCLGRLLIDVPLTRAVNPERTFNIDDAAVVKASFAL